MQSDREFLELVAKAAGIDGEYKQLLTGDEISRRGVSERLLNLLTDDGDALRLAVKLCIRFSCMSGIAHAWTGLREFGEAKGADPFAATRRAIVRAVAEIATWAHPDHKDGVANDHV